MKIFITGISSGIGLALTRELVRRKHIVWGIARRQELLEQLQKELGEEYLRITECNLENIEDMNKVAHEMKAQQFLPDIIVLNAAMYTKNAPGSFDLGTYRKFFDINLFGAMFWVETFLPDFFSRGSGQFIAISSTSAFRQGFGNPAYSGSKAALSMTFRRLRAEFSKTSIKFTTIYFGPIHTEMWTGRKPSVFVPSSYKAAKFIIKIINNNGEYFFPWRTTLFSRLSLFLPEAFAVSLTRKFYK